MLSDAAEEAGLDLALAFAISNLAWALGHVFGAGRGRRGRGRHQRHGALHRARGAMRDDAGGPHAQPAPPGGAQRLAAAVRPGRGAALPVQLQRELVLDPLGGVRRVAAAAEVVPGGAAELVLAAVGAARRDRARVAARLALGDAPQDGRDPDAVRWLVRRSERELNGFSPSAPRVSGPTMPSGTRSWRRWKRFTARSVIGPKTPSAERPSWRWMLRTAEPRSPRLTTISLEALAPPDALAPGSASAGTAAAQSSAAHTAITARCEPRTACRILDTNNSPFQCLRGELTGSRRKVALRDTLVAIRPSGRTAGRNWVPRSPPSGQRRLGSSNQKSCIQAHRSGGCSA